MPPTDRPALPDRHLRVVAVYARTWSCKRAAHELRMKPVRVRQVLGEARTLAGVSTTGELLELLGWLRIPTEHL